MTAREKFAEAAARQRAERKREASRRNGALGAAKRWAGHEREVKVKPVAPAGYISSVAAEQAWGLSRSGINRAIQEGRCRAVKVGRAWYVDPDSRAARVIPARTDAQTRARARRWFREHGLDAALIAQALDAFGAVEQAEIIRGLVG